MSDLITINNIHIQIKEYKGQRVVTFKDIDEVHQRPEGTAARNFRENRDKFVLNEDYFYLADKELANFKQATNFVGSNAKELILITESGYLMLVKSFTDGLAWQVQRQLVNTYFRAKELVQPMTQIQILQQAVNILAAHEQKLLEIEEKQQILEHRITNLDAVDINGDLQQRLNKLVRRYAFKAGVLHSIAWEHFKQAYNTAYRTNLELLIRNYEEREGIKKITIPQYLSLTGRLEDGIRVADKMLNSIRTA